MADPNDQWAAFNPQPAPSTPSVAPGRPVITGPAPEPKVTYRPLPKNDPRYRPDFPSAQIGSDGKIDFGPQSKQEAQNPQQVITGDMNADHVIRSIKTARSQIGAGYDTGNFFGSKAFQGVPYFGQNSANLSATLSGLQGSVINDTIAQLKALSATGASGYGSLSETEAERLAGSVAALQQTQDATSLKRNLDELERHYRAARAIIAGEDPRNPDVAAKYGITGQANASGGHNGSGEFGGRKDIPALNPQQQAAYDAFTAAHPNASADQIRSFFSAIGFDAQNADAVAKAAQQGAGFRPASDAILKPNISDVRGGENTSGQDAMNATVRGVLDVPTMGALDKIIAAGDTLFKGGTFDQNLARQYAISDYDQQNHPFARFGGQVVGGGLLPFGEIGSLGNAALKAGGYGAAYGAGSSRSLAAVPQNALLGGAVGAATPVALAGAGRAIAAPFRRGAQEMPPLIDPSTGELSQPMDAMNPAARVQMFRDHGFQTVTPGMAGGRSARVMEQGFNNLPGSAGIMEDVNSGISANARRAMQNTAQQFGSSKTLNEGGAELQRGAQDYIGRFQQVSSKAYNAIPISDKAPASLNNTVSTLERLSSRFQSNPDLADMANNSKFQAYLDAFQKHGLSWKDLKDFRSMVGDKIGEMRFGENDSTGDFRALYGALSEDMRNTAANMGPRAIRAFERANTLYRQGQDVIDNALERILGPNAKGSPERAAAAVQAMTKGGKSTGDLKTLAQIRAATIKSGAWDEIASTLIHLGGQPANSEGRAFNPQTFINWYADMSEPARAMLFKPELRKSLDSFVATAQQLSRVKGLTNTSNTTPTMIGSGFISALGTSAGVGFINPVAWLGTLGMAAGAGVNNIMARVWTSPQFVNLLTGFSKAVASGSKGAIKSQIGRMNKLASTNPELRQGIEAFLKNLANDNAPNVGQVAASPNQGPQDQGQPQQ